VTVLDEMVETAAKFQSVMRPGDEHNVCGCTALDAQGLAQQPARFPDACKAKITIYINRADWPGDGQMGMRFDAWQAVYAEACREWNDAAGLRFRLVPSSRAAIAEVDFDELGGQTLAWSHLADGSCASNKRQRYDHRQWNAHLLRLTALHELGHLIGLQHKNGPYVMNPTILTGLNGLTSEDIRRARGLGYGNPETPDPPSPEPPPDPEDPKSEIPWDRIAREVLRMLSRCISLSGESRVRAGLRRPGIRQLFGIRRAVRRAGLNGKALESASDALVHDMLMATEWEIDSIVSEAKSLKFVGLLDEHGELADAAVADICTEIP